MSFIPLNHDVLPLAGIEADADYALVQFASLREKLSADIPADRHAGATFLEIGPGRNLALALLVRDMGFEVLVADRFPVAWQPYHTALYTHLQGRLHAPSPALRQALEQGAHVGIRVIAEPLQALSSIAAKTVDFAYSCAVLEHACQEDNVQAVVTELARVSCPGAIHYHYVDLRYHLDLHEHPLGQMLMTDQEFRELTRERLAEDGTRLRAMEFEAHFMHAGFEINDFHVTEWREVPADTQAQLRGLARSAYRNWPVADLAILSFGVRLRLPADAAEIRHRVDHGGRLLALIASFKSASHLTGNPLAMWWRSLFRRYGPYRRFLRPIIRHLGVKYVRPLWGEVSARMGRR